MNEELDMIAESFGVRLAPSRRTAFALRRMEATVVSASPEGLTTVTDALEGVNDLTSDPRFAAGVLSALLSPDAAYIGLVLPTSGDMRAGWLVDDDDDGLDGNTDAGVGTD
jgi:hypothetical protein